MPKITVLPHAEICPQGAEFETQSGVSVADALLDHHVDIEHACGKVAACTTCHCIIRKGFKSLPPAEDNEEDLLDRAWGLTAVSRLSCQAVVQKRGLTIEIPNTDQSRQRSRTERIVMNGSTAKTSRYACRKISGRRSRTVRFTDLRVGVRAGEFF